MSQAVNEDVRAALVGVARRLDGAGVPYALGGSGLLWALGLTEEVRDLDLQLDDGDAGRLVDTAGAWLVSVTYRGTELWASRWHARLSVGGVDVDAIGGLAFRHRGGIARLPLRTGGVVEVGGVAVPYGDPALWWALYRAYKPNKSALLEAVVDQPARDRVRAELGLPRDW